MALTRCRDDSARRVALLVAFVLVCAAAVMSSWLCTEGPQYPSVGDSTSSTVDDPSFDVTEELERVMRDKDVPDGSDDGELTAETVERTAEALGHDVSTTIREEKEDGEVPDVARSMLERYRAETCLLVSSGYMDLMGGVWGCVTQGPGWVDVCVVKQEVDHCCTVRRVRLSASGMGGRNGV